MGAGIAQISAQAGLTVHLFDVRDGAALAARDNIATTLGKLAQKGKISPADAEAAVSRLVVSETLGDLADCELVIEAIMERLDAKQALLTDLETVVAEKCILATNTSSLSVTRLASTCRHPERVAGFHFFNPVPLMKVVEVVDGLATDSTVGDALLALAARLGHRGVRAKDTPGFIVNHAGRAYGTEALKILGECVASFSEIDRILRESAGFRMGPPELFDLTGLDVSHPVMESIYNQLYQEPRYRPSALTRQMLEDGRIGRKAGQGFYRYESGKMNDPPPPQSVPKVDHLPPVWIGAEDDKDRDALVTMLQSLGATVEQGPRASEAALCLLAPYGYDATTASALTGSDPRRTLCIDMLPGVANYRTLMTTPATDAAYRDAGHALFARDGVGVTVIHDSVGFVVQRTLAAIVNLACDIAQQGIASADDIEEAVKLGLGYPQGPLSLGDALGPARLNTILSRMLETTGDPRYRPLVETQGSTRSFPPTPANSRGVRIRHMGNCLSAQTESRKTDRRCLKPAAA
jgi:3-hydroxybutyryl-CoA dehydrogenase